MSKVYMYTKNYCPYCDLAKELLSQYENELTEYDVQNDAARLHEMLERSQRRTVPQIFIDELHVGGYDDLAALESSGDLEKLLTPKGDI